MEDTRPGQIGRNAPVHVEVGAVFDTECVQTLLRLMVDNTAAANQSKLRSV